MPDCTTKDDCDDENPCTEGEAYQVHVLTRYTEGADGDHAS